MFKQDSKHLDRLADVQTGWQTLGRAGRHTDRNENTWAGWQTGWQILRKAARCSNRMENTWTGWQMFKQDGKHLERLADVQTG
jgi:hypothetical protein